MLLRQIYGDLVAVLPADKQTENKAHNLGGFLVDYPKILVVRVFHIAVGGFGGNRLSAHALRFNAGLYFLADVLCVPLRHDVDKGRKPCHSSGGMTIYQYSIVLTIPLN